MTRIERIKWRGVVVSKTRIHGKTWLLGHFFKWTARKERDKRMVGSMELWYEPSTRKYGLLIAHFVGSGWTFLRSMRPRIVMGLVIRADNSHAKAILSKTALRDTSSGVWRAWIGFLMPIYLPTLMKHIWSIDELQHRTSQVTQRLQIVDPNGHSPETN